MDVSALVLLGGSGAGAPRTEAHPHLVAAQQQKMRSPEENGLVIYLNWTQIDVI